MTAGSRMRRVAVGAVLAVLASAVAILVATVADGEDPRRMSTGAMGMAHGNPQLDEAGYLAEMAAHHEEAVAAATELARSDRPEMRAFGRSVVAVQYAQIREMRGWLADWYPDRPVEVDYRPMMRDLTGRSGDDLDRVFLEDMIGHHMAAVMMSQHLLVRGTDHEQVAVLARSIRDDQHDEIVQMRRWLRLWFGA